MRNKLKTPATIVLLSQAGITELGDQLREIVARRAYEIFERRGRLHAHDLADWLQAESEIVRDLPADIQESAEQIRARIDLTGLDPAALQVGVEPRRIIVEGKKLPSHDGQNGILGGDGNDGETFCFLDLPAEVDAPKATAVIEGQFLEVVAEKIPT